MRVALYARVSTSDREQDPETQLLVLRDYCESKGWMIVEEFVDEGSARDLRRRTSWRKLLDLSYRRQFAAVVVMKLDRAFRSVKDMHDTLGAWERVGVSFLSVHEAFDTSTPVGRLMMNLLASVAEFELEMIRDRVRAGMDRARREGARIGRPLLGDQEGVKNRFAAILPRVYAGNISARKAAAEMGVSDRTFRRMVAGEEARGQGDTCNSDTS